MGSEVQVLPGPPYWGCSSAGRAPALHAGGHRFDPVHLHQRLEINGRRVVGFVEEKFALTRHDKLDDIVKTKKSEIYE